MNKSIEQVIIDQALAIIKTRNISLANVNIGNLEYEGVTLDTLPIYQVMELYSKILNTALMETMQNMVDTKTVDNINDNAMKQINASLVNNNIDNYAMTGTISQRFMLTIITMLYETMYSVIKTQKVTPKTIGSYGFFPEIIKAKNLNEELIRLTQEMEVLIDKTINGIIANPLEYYSFPDEEEMAKKIETIEKLSDDLDTIVGQSSKPEGGAKIVIKMIVSKSISNLSRLKKQNLVIYTNNQTWDDKSVIQQILKDEIDNLCKFDELSENWDTSQTINEIIKHLEEKGIQDAYKLVSEYFVKKANVTDMKSKIDLESMSIHKDIMETAEALGYNTTFVAKESEKEYLLEEFDYTIDMYITEDMVKEVRAKRRAESNTHRADRLIAQLDY